MNVSQNALHRRISRKLAHDSERLITPRYGSRMELEYGPRYIVDDRNIMIAWSCDLEDLGRELGVLHEDEWLAPS